MASAKRGPGSPRAQQVPAGRKQPDSRLRGNIVLCGFMGCGKTTVGRRLAKVLGRRFVDLDQFIEEREGCSVPEIFAREGEEGFRRRETQAVRAVAREQGLVVACGGGTVLFPQNVRAFREGGGVILFLDVPLPLLQARLEKSRTVRPLLQVEDPRKAVEELYRRRIAKYRGAADIRVKSTAPPWVMAKRIAAMEGELAEVERRRADHEIPSQGTAGSDNAKKERRKAL